MPEKGKTSATRLTTRAVTRFSRGQMEYHIRGGNLRRGMISSIVVENGALIVTFLWVAQAAGSWFPRRWVRDRNLAYRTDLKTYTVEDIGRSMEGQDTRILLSSATLREYVILYPPNGEKLNPNEVDGLVLSART